MNLRAVPYDFARYIYTYVRDGQLTLAGLRGSRPAQLIERIGAVNQAGADVRHLIRTGKPSAG